MSNTDLYKTTENTAAELNLLTAQVDAHRFVLAWLLKQVPNEAGHHFLATQTNIFNNGNKSQHGALIVEELDDLRGRLAVLYGEDAPAQPPRQ